MATIVSPELRLVASNLGIILSGDNLKAVAMQSTTTSTECTRRDQN